MTFICFCKMRFSTVDQLRFHMNKHGHQIRCSCGRLFKDINKVRQHRKASGKPHDGATPYETYPPLHLKATLLSGLPQECSVCGQRCSNELGLQTHKKAKHPECPTCGQHFSSKNQRNDHQYSTGHCYCDEHVSIFETVRSFNEHNRAYRHTTTYGCIDCDREFRTQCALDDHLMSDGHAAIAVAAHERVSSAGAEAAASARVAAEEEANLRCYACHKDFRNAYSWKQHKVSVKHKPLSELGCPLSVSCSKTFTSPSALIQHLESGGCKSGMNRLQLNVLVHQNDSSRQITSAKNAASIMSTAGDATSLPSMTELTTCLDALSIFNGGGQGSHTLTDFSDVASDVSDSSGVPIHTPITSHSRSSSVSGGVILTPTTCHSRSSSISGGGVALTPTTSNGEWSFVNGNGVTLPSTTSVDGSSVNTMRYDVNQKAWPCIVAGCIKSFQKQQSLLEHLQSAFHAPKLFHCPTILAGKHSLSFKTLSGFAQHIEAGACNGGKEVLGKIAEMFEEKIALMTGRKVKLLKESGEDGV